MTMRKTMGMRICLGLMTTGLGVISASAQDAARPDAKVGQALYNASGCYECHGYSGAGSSQGPRLVSPKPFPAFLQQLRLPVSAMPPYEANVLSDAQAADIYAFVSGLPKPPDAATIKLLNE
jgi:mono/diheme cytochrome c family protein